MIMVETPRLLLRDWRETDVEPFRQLNADPEVMRYFLKPLSGAESEEFLGRIRAEIQSAGFGLYAVEHKDSGAFIGLLGFHVPTFEADFTPCVEIGWRLTREAWGHGYATEGASACLAYGFEQLGFDEVYSFTSVPNKPSQRVMQKIGMTFAKTFGHPKVERDHPLYQHVLYRAVRPV
jgi:[ribosomal protein S5]-alanine N-acetyltransferase